MLQKYLSTTDTKTGVPWYKPVPKDKNVKLKGYDSIQHIHMGKLAEMIPALVFWEEQSNGTTREKVLDVVPLSDVLKRWILKVYMAYFKETWIKNSLKK